MPAEFQKLFLEHMANNRSGGTPASYLTRKMEAWLHQRVARDVRGRTGQATLEIGAGSLNQLAYERTVPYDIVEPSAASYGSSKYRDRVGHIYADISEIRPPARYDRITSIAVFEHILDLPQVVARTCLLLKENGTLRVAIPNEGTLLWKLGWAMTTGLEFRLKYGLKYGILMKHEHVNSAQEVEEVLGYFYKRLRCSCLDVGRRLAFYRFYECSAPQTELAGEYLA